MNTAVTGQDVGAILFPPSDGGYWLTKCQPLEWDHEMSLVSGWPARQDFGFLPADGDIAEGHLRSFDSIDDLIADLKTLD